MQTIQEFIDAHNITMDSEPAFENPNMDGDIKMAHFQVRITGPDAVMVCHYSVGPGIVERLVRDNYPSQAKRVGDFRPGHLTIDEERFIKTHANEYRPNVADVLDSLASDSSGYEGCRDFKDWAGDYGYDTDSRKAEATWRAVSEQSRNLRYALGMDVYRQLLEEVERL